MSVEILHHTAHGHPPEQAHQFEDMAQQNECYIVGMWTFLVTEIMFFGALFIAYTTYRTLHPEVFIAAHRVLNWKLGTLNTVVLLTSSLFMALAVYNAQMKRKSGQLIWIALTILCAFTFLVVKGFEWKADWDENVIPGTLFAGKSFHFEGAAEEGTAAAVEAPFTREKTTIPQGQAEMFFVLYFIMTGLHGIHVIIGILVLGTMWLMIKFNHPHMRYYMWVEMAGLYWHFVDIVWIFLFPLYYLIPGK